MKIAVSADLHLTTRERNPERYHALENILGQMTSREIGTLLLAGDTFDDSSRNYAEFEEFCNRPEHREIHFKLLPGNHDVALDARSLTASNVEVVTAPAVWRPDPACLPLLLLPYVENKTMGEYIAANSAELTPGKWILIGHGDWTHGIYEPDPTEPGIYMPLTRSDLQTYRPAVALLGHIHKRVDEEILHYVGSPCGLGIRETGERRFLLLDCVSATVEALAVETDFIYMKESLVVLPVEDELEQIRQQITERIEAWKLEQEQLAKVRLQVRVSGYTRDKRTLEQAVAEGFRGLTFYNEGKPDLEQVFMADDEGLSEIAQLACDRIPELKLAPHLPQPDREAVVLHALHTIYGK